MRKGWTTLPLCPVLICWLLCDHQCHGSDSAETNTHGPDTSSGLDELVEKLAEKAQPEVLKCGDVCKGGARFLAYAVQVGDEIEQDGVLVVFHELNTTSILKVVSPSHAIVVKITEGLTPNSVQMPDLIVATIQPFPPETSTSMLYAEEDVTSTTEGAPAAMLNSSRPLLTLPAQDGQVVVTSKVVGIFLGWGLNVGAEVGIGDHILLVEQREADGSKKSGVSEEEQQVPVQSDVVGSVVALQNLVEGQWLLPGDAVAVILLKTTTTTTTTAATTSTVGITTLPSERLRSSERIRLGVAPGQFAVRSPCEGTIKEWRNAAAVGIVREGDVLVILGNVSTQDCPAYVAVINRSSMTLSVQAPSNGTVVANADLKVGAPVYADEDLLVMQRLRGQADEPVDLPPGFVRAPPGSDYPIMRAAPFLHVEDGDTLVVANFADTFTRWLVEVGDEVQKGETLCTIFNSQDRESHDIIAPKKGIVKARQKLAVGAVVYSGEHLLVLKPQSSAAEEEKRLPLASGDLDIALCSSSVTGVFYRWSAQDRANVEEAASIATMVDGTGSLVDIAACNTGRLLILKKLRPGDNVREGEPVAMVEFHAEHHTDIVGPALHFFEEGSADDHLKLLMIWLLLLSCCFFACFLAVCIPPRKDRSYAPLLTGEEEPEPLQPQQLPPPAPPPVHPPPPPQRHPEPQPPPLQPEPKPQPKPQPKPPEPKPKLPEPTPVVAVAAATAVPAVVAVKRTVASQPLFAGWSFIPVRSTEGFRQGDYIDIAHGQARRQVVEVGVLPDRSPVLYIGERLVYFHPAGCAVETVDERQPVPSVAVEFDYGTVHAEYRPLGIDILGDGHGRLRVCGLYVNSYAEHLGVDLGAALRSVGGEAVNRMENPQAAKSLLKRELAGLPHWPLRIVFDAGGREQAIDFAYRPLGFRLSLFQPLRVEEFLGVDSLAKQLGVQTGWHLLRIGNRAVDVSDSHEAIMEVLDTMITTLPRCPLRTEFQDTRGAIVRVLIERSPLGIIFAEQMPVVINLVAPASYASQLGLQPGWELLRIGDVDMWSLHTPQEAQDMLSDAIAHLAVGQQPRRSQ